MKYSVSYNIVIIIGLFAYFGLFQKYNNGQTIGKKIMKIKRLSSLLIQRRKPILPRYHSTWQLRARFRHRHTWCESRLSGNGEDTRFCLNKRLSRNTRGPVTSFPSALPRTARQLSGASRKDFFPVIVSVRFSVGI